MFDITSLAPVETAFLHLKNPVDEEPIVTNGAAVGITFHAPGSDAYEAAQAKRTNRALVRSKKKIELTADLLRSDTVGFLAEITASFDGLAYPPAAGVSGQELFRALYADRKYGWVVDQANVFLVDWANFTKGSAKS